ncbi:MAG: hypothetical protein HRU06_18730 [Oceanospirillaceae bacterium]|nr:hypothetical protein [Oceanospirillaceae bacterium]
MITNYWLFIAGVFTDLAGLFHLLIIVGGASWYRFFGAGEKMAAMAEQGSFYPHIITFVIATILGVWGLYAFAGAGLISQMPLMQYVLVGIFLVFFVRAVAGLVAYLMIKPNSTFMLNSSLICLGYSLLFGVGTYQVWLTI